MKAGRLILGYTLYFKFIIQSISRNSAAKNTVNAQSNGK